MAFITFITTCRGRLAHLRCHGMMDAERGVAMREDAIFRFYSMTKPIVCVATLMLVEHGAIALHDPVSRWLPALGGLQVAGPDGVLTAPRRPLTVHDLLTFLSVALLVGHLYLALIHPSTRHALRGMTTGEVDEDWAKKHHAKWVEAERLASLHERPIP